MLNAGILDNMLTESWQLENDLNFVAEQIMFHFVRTPNPVAQLRDWSTSSTRTTAS